MLQDMRLGLRRVLHTPGFSIAVVLILAIGTAAATAMASVLYALAYKPLTLPNPDTIVGVSSYDSQDRARAVPLAALEHLQKADLPAGNWCAHVSMTESTGVASRVLQSDIEVMSGDCAGTIQLAPVLGRWFTPAEAPASGPGAPVAIITHRYWQRMFNGRADVLGSAVQLQDKELTVVGVMPETYAGFWRDTHADIIIPFNSHRAMQNTSRILGRLKPGATLEQLQTQVRALWPSVLDAATPASPTRAQTLAEMHGGAESLALGFSILRRLYAEPVQRLALLTVALLALVCINVGGLMVTRITSRLHEISAMRAIGASTARIVFPLAVECAALAIAGTALGMPLAIVASNAFGLLFPTGNMPWTLQTTPEAIVFVAVAGGLIVMIAVIAALPMWLAARRSPQLRIDRGSSRTTSRWAQSMLVSQIAMTVALVFTCGLVVRSFYGLQNVDRGFQREQLLSLRLSANPGGYKDLNAAIYYPALVDRLAAVPGVQSVGLARYFGTINAQLSESPIGFVGNPDNPATGASDFVSPGFFATLGVPLLSGRDIAWTDSPDTERVAVVSESLARMLSPDANVVGRTIRFGTTPKYAEVRIVGVAGNISIGNVRKTKERMLYLSSVQSDETTFASAHVRTSGPPMQFAQAATQAVESLGREHVMGAFAEMLFGNSMVAERMGTVISGIVALLALIISCIGIFALLLNNVERRTREIGIRIAIGASQRAVSKLILGQAVRLVAIGLLLGIPAAFASTSLVRSLLFEVTETDQVTLAASAAALLLTGLLGAIRPTLKAMRVDPAVALRTE